MKFIEHGKNSLNSKSTLVNLLNAHFISTKPKNIPVIFAVFSSIVTFSSFGLADSLVKTPSSKVTNVSLDDKSIAKKLIVEPASTDKQGVLTKWLAMGSGCGQSASNAKGPVSLVSENLSSTSDLLAASFDLQNFVLDSEILKQKNWPVALVRIQKTDPTKKLRIPAECSLRLAIQPPPNRRIASVEATWHADVSKSVGLVTRQEAFLVLGDKSVASKSEENRAEDSLSNAKKELNVAFSNMNKSFPKLGCGEAKLVGVDLKFSADLNAASQIANLKGGSHPVEFQILFENCK